MYGPGAHAQTIALFALVSVQLGHMFNCRSRVRSAFDDLFTNPFLWIAAFIVVALQLLAVYFSPLARVLGTVEPTATDWVIICSAGLLVIGIVELAKLAFRRQQRTSLAKAQLETTQ